MAGSLDDRSIHLCFVMPDVPNIPAMPVKPRTPPAMLVMPPMVMFDDNLRRRSAIRRGRARRLESAVWRR